MLFNRRYYFLAFALCLSVFIESVMLTYVQQSGSVFYFSSSILYFLSGLAVCVIPLIPSQGGAAAVREPLPISRIISYLFILFFLFLVVHHVIRLIPFYRDIHIDKHWADMLPCIQVACQRFLAGQTVYGPAPQIWPTSIIPYLPMMWIPFLPAEILKFDYRWITIIFQFIGLYLAFKPTFDRKKKIPFFPSVLAGFGLFLLLNYFLWKNYHYWVLTEEGIVAFFYLLLSFALLRKNYWLIGLAITGCILSRYSLLFWVPVYFAFVLLTRPRPDFWKLVLSSGISMMLLFVLPFFIRDPAYFIGIPLAYNMHAGDFWELNRLNIHQYYMVGFFKFFDITQVGYMVVLSTVTAFAAPLLFLAIAQWLRKKYAIQDRYVAWGSLKISLVFFFGFIQMPYQYIFVPLTIISYVVLFDYLSQLSATSES